MPNLLILIKQEEIPFSEVQNVNKSIASDKFIHSYQILSNEILVMIEIKKFYEFPEQKIIGPKINAPQIAIEGFYTKYANNGGRITKDEENGVYVFIKEASTKTADEIAPEVVESILDAISRKWKETLDLTINGNNLPWCRPIHSISAFLDGKPITHKFAFNSLEEIPQLANITTLKVINDEINRIEKELGITCVSRESVAELAHVYDNPQFQIGEIPSQYLSLPKELLRLTIAKNQRYILFEQGGKIVEQFLIVGKKHSEEILKGHIKTLKARLEDAKYYIEDDLKTFKTNEVSPSLEKIIFHERYGSIAKRVEEMKILAEKIFKNASSQKKEQLQQVIIISKNDLTTQSVQSFTELQGYMGGFYLENLGIDAEISNAVSQHYKPLNPSDDLPNSILGKQLSLIDKLQKINALAEIGEIPTSSRDPFAIRRDILSIIRIWDNIFPNNLEELATIIDTKLQKFLEERLKLYHKEFKQ